MHVHATATLSNNSNTILLPVYIFAATLATCLCTIVGIIIVTICALKQARRRRDLRMLPVPLYDEITDPIYATVPAALNEDKSKPSVENVDTQIELSRNDACKQDLSQNVHTAQPHSIGVTLLTDNTAYNIPGNSTDSTVLTWNDSYHFAMSMRSDNKSANTSDIPEGDAN